MPRRSSGGGFRSSGRGFSPFRSSNSSSRSSFAQSRPMPAQSRPAPTQQYAYTRSPGMFSGIGSTLATGMAFGAGSQIAHQAIRGIMGNSYQPVYVQQAPGQTQEQYQQQVRQANQQQPCFSEINNFAQCIQKNDNDIGSCQKYSDLLKECKAKLDGK